MEDDDSISISSLSISNNMYFVGSTREKEDLLSEQEMSAKPKLPTWTKSSDATDAGNDDEDDDEDDEEQEEEEEEVESESEYSDWNLDVYFNDNARDVVSYSIHRFVCGTQSEYFKGVFRFDATVSQSYERWSTIILPTPVTIQHFEMLLDYFYTGKLELDNENAISMVYFGDYFGITLLKEQAQRYIGSVNADAVVNYDINASVPSKLLSTFYRDAKILAMEDLLKAIAYACAYRPGLISKDTALSKIADIQFWCRIFAARKKKKYSSDDKAESISELWSVNVAHFFELNSDIVDVESFEILTESISLPNISAEAAVILMEQEQKLFLGAVKVNGDDLTSLQQRCIDSLVDSKTGTWNVSNPRTLLQGKLRKLQPSVLESLMLRIMDCNKGY